MLALLYFRGIDMKNSNIRVAGERSRLRQVRQTLTAATANPASGGPDRANFYLAIGDYFEAAMERLHEQDIRMGDMLREKADLEDPKNKQAMAELEERLSGNQLHLEKMLGARDRLRAAAEPSVTEFESAGGAYAQFIVDNMGHHGGTTDMAAEVFSPADWEHMTLVSAAAQQREQELIAAVFNLLPADVTAPDDI
jgi:hypothetical protein